jgi:hypothetical protein
MNAAFEETYPNITAWVKEYGWIEIGEDDHSTSFVRVLDIGGLIWESSENYETMDEALQKLEVELRKWMEENL